MKKIVTAIFAITFLSGCAFNSSPSKQVVNEDLFSKKKECAKLQNEIEARIKRDYNGDIGNGDTQFAQFDKIFYSPQRNTCMYTMQISAYINSDLYETHNLMDAFTNEKIETERGCYHEKCKKTESQAWDDFYNKVKQYE